METAAKQRKEAKERYLKKECVHDERSARRKELEKEEGELNRVIPRGDDQGIWTVVTSREFFGFRWAED